MAPREPRKVFILKHVPNEDAGTILPFLKKKKIPFKTISLYKEKAPEISPQEVRAAVIMGGPMNVYEEAKYPFLKWENAFLKKMFQNKIPCLGICLGAQLLAKALGAKVVKAKAPEVGWDRVVLSREAKSDLLFSEVPGRDLQVLQWHEDTFGIPKGAVRLAESRGVPNQAFRYKEFIYGLQFHIEVDRAMLKDWFKKRGDLPQILSTYDCYKKRLSAISAAIYQKFFSLSE